MKTKAQIWRPYRFPRGRRPDHYLNPRERQALHAAQPISRVAPGTGFDFDCWDIVRQQVLRLRDLAMDRCGQQRTAARLAAHARVRTARRTPRCRSGRSRAARTRRAAGSRAGPDGDDPELPGSEPLAGRNHNHQPRALPHERHEAVP
jgi:hypothetical protein